MDIDKLGLIDNIEISDIPTIDLYIDQVIQLFEGKLSSYKRNDEDKILTKTMINNYVKGKFLMPVNKKKYTKEHIILMSFIYQLKGALSISDIKELLVDIVSNIENGEEEFSIEQTYEKYLEINKKNYQDFDNEINALELLINEINIENEKERKLLLATSLINKANMYRKLAETIIDKKDE